MAALDQALVELADELATKIRDNVNKNNLPKVIADATSIGDVQSDNNSKWIDVIVDVKQAPMAGAFEFGSGEHAPESPARYRIPNEGNDWVAFPEERWPGVTNPELLPRLPDGRFIFQFVMHPGVEAKPYIQPAIQDIRKTIRKKLGAAFKAEVLLLYGNTKVTVIE